MFSVTRLRVRNVTHFLQDNGALSGKQKQLNEVEGGFLKMKAQEQQDLEAFAAAQRKFQAVSSGLFSNEEGGDDATLQDQLMRECIHLNEPEYTMQFVI